MSLLIPPYLFIGNTAALGGVEDTYAYVNDETRTYVAAMTTKPSDTDKGHYDTFIGALKTAGVWAKKDCLYILGAHDSQAGLLNLITPGSYTLTAVNSPAFQAYRGYTPSLAGAYLTSGWDAANNAVKMAQNSAHIDGYALNNPTASDRLDVGTGTTVAQGIRAREEANGAGARITGATFISSTAPAETMPVHVMGIRRSGSSGTVRVWRNGAENNTGASTSGALTTADFDIGRHNSANTDRQMFAAGWGGELDDTEAAALYSALYTLAVAFGADT